MGQRGNRERESRKGQDEVLPVHASTLEHFQAGRNPARWLKMHP
jgi:hypothetical protein